MSTVVWPEMSTVLAVHEALISRFGGSHGVRDEALLESALAQPLQSFAGDDLYPGLSLKAARLAYGVVVNHPFFDGNKRTGAALLGAVLHSNGVTFAPKAGALADAILEVAAGAWSFDDFAAWVDRVLLSAVEE
ncbi:MAG: type II toxin-antitoxin system death-on-curing family toxin [Actinomycetaceae bacterium]|nr:type II toxin-antitoxin system death-on-curing family toxin [Actinomycetaceae bacterium]